MSDNRTFRCDDYPANGSEKVNVTLTLAELEEIMLALRNSVRLCERRIDDARNNPLADMADDSIHYYGSCIFCNHPLEKNTAPCRKCGK